MDKKKELNFDLSNLTADELRKLSESISERIFELKKEEEIAESQEFCKTLEFGLYIVRKNIIFITIIQYI